MASDHRFERGAHQQRSAVRLLILAAVLLMTFGCSDAGEFDGRVSSPDENYMSDVARELDAAGVDFRVLRDGAIAYRSGDEHILRSIQERLKNDAAERGRRKQ